MAGRRNPSQTPFTSNGVTGQAKELKVPYTIADGITLLREVDRFRPFEHDDDVPIAKIYWDIVIDKLHQCDMFLEWTGQKLEDHLKGILYGLELSEIKELLNCDVVSSAAAATETQTQSLIFKTLLQSIFVAWSFRQLNAEFQSIKSYYGYTEDDIGSLSSKCRREVMPIARKSLRQKRVAELEDIEKRDAGQTSVARDKIPVRVDSIRIDYLYGHRKGRPVEWITYLKNKGIETISNAGGWGNSKSDPSSFHSAIIKVLNQNEALRNDIELKAQIGKIRYHDVQQILNDSPVEAFARKPIKSVGIANHSADTAASQSSPASIARSIVRFNDVPIRDLWLQTLIRSLAKPHWLETLEANNIKTIGDLGGWKSSDSKFAADLIQKLETELGFRCPKSAQREIKLLKFEDVKDVLDEGKKVNVHRGACSTGILGWDTLHDVISASDPTPRTTKKGHPLQLGSKGAGVHNRGTPKKSTKRQSELEKEVEDLQELNLRMAERNSAKSGSEYEDIDSEGQDEFETEARKPRSRRVSKRKSKLRPVNYCNSESSESDEPVRKRQRAAVAPSATLTTKMPAPYLSGSPSPAMDNTPDNQGNAATSQVTGSRAIEVAEITPESFHDGFLKDYRQLRVLVDEMSERVKQQDHEIQELRGLRNTQN
ncbi:hypothetical protein TWF696_009623 [Orbilia brochopaga]|uniref:Uncharacterized protein n=1 Tax=Orbilia brochopaga TaxID=3140254 RepID=A0AAV9UC30_9PEZI